MGLLLCSQNEPYHPGQWAIAAWDLDRDAQRNFALASIHSWADAIESVTDEEVAKQ
jgi:hypothetical protein